MINIYYLIINSMNLYKRLVEMYMIIILIRINMINRYNLYNKYKIIV